MFDPWTASFDEAENAQNEFINCEPSPRHPIHQWYAAVLIDSKKSAIEQGNGFAVLACIRDCVTHGLVAPDWLALEFNKRFYAVTSCKVKSWDDPDSFGAPYKKGVHLNAMRKQLVLKYQVYNKAREILNSEPDTPIDSLFFEQVGELVTPPVGKTEAARLYYLVKGELKRLVDEKTSIERYPFKPIKDRTSKKIGKTKSS